MRRGCSRCPRARAIVTWCLMQSAKPDEPVEDFKDKAVTEKVIDLGPGDPKDSNVKDPDPPR